MQQEPNSTKKSSAASRVLGLAALVALGWITIDHFRGLLGLGNIDSAIGRVRAVSAAETDFAKQHPELGYTCTLWHLPRREEIMRLLAKDRIDNGYAFEISGCQVAAPQEPNSTYSVTARPLHAGQPAFCSDQSGILMSDEGGSVKKCLAKQSPLP